MALRYRTLDAERRVGEAHKGISPLASFGALRATDSLRVIVRQPPMSRG
jgi:hypothetical protein